MQAVKVLPAPVASTSRDLRLPARKEASSFDRASIWQVRSPRDDRNG